MELMVLIRNIESLKGYFSQFGEVTECTVMRDGTTGRSRGFGFLTFKDPKTVNIVMVKEHYLDGKIVSLLIFKGSCFDIYILQDWSRLRRLIPNAQFPEMNRKRLRRSSWGASPKRLLSKTSENTLISSEEFLMRL